MIRMTDQILYSLSFKFTLRASHEEFRQLYREELRFRQRKERAILCRIRSMMSDTPLCLCKYPYLEDYLQIAQEDSLSKRFESNLQ